MNVKSLLKVGRGDIDGFFGLFVDNLVQLLMIVSLCALCGIQSHSELLLDYILPGAAISILIGNIFYAWQAYRLGKKESRSDVTALQYGINTPSLIIYIFFVMKPAYDAQYAGLIEDGLSIEVATAQAARFAWQLGLIACLGSGLIEFFGSLFAEIVRVKTPPGGVVVHSGGDRHRLYRDDFRIEDVRPAAGGAGAIGVSAALLLFQVQVSGGGFREDFSLSSSVRCLRGSVRCLWTRQSLDPRCRLLK